MGVLEMEEWSACIIPELDHFFLLEYWAVISFNPASLLLSLPGERKVLAAGEELRGWIFSWSR